MKLAFIAPISHLQEISSLGSLAFFLGHLFDNRAYRQYYDMCKETGGYIMVDNGVVETGIPMAGEELIELAQTLQPDELIGPDFRDEAERTLRALEDFIPPFRASCRGIKLVGVAHGKSFGEWIDCYKALGQMDVDVIGIPYRLAFGPVQPNSLNWAMDRAKVLRFISNNMWAGMSYHCLGLNTIDELSMFTQMGWIRSCDSTFLYQQTLAWGLFRPGVRVHKKPTDVMDFFHVSEPEVITLMRRNAFYLKYLANDTDPILGGFDIGKA